MQMNGKIHCPVDQDWQEYKVITIGAAKKTEETHRDMTRILQHTQHLTKLDDISNTMKDVRDNLISVAVGKKQIELETANRIFKILGIVILAQSAIIFFLLTGESFNIFGALHR